MAVFWAGPLNAQYIPPDCKHSQTAAPPLYNFEDDVVLVRINVDSIGDPGTGAHESTYTANEFVAAAQVAMQQWNDTSNSVSWVYDGKTSLTEGDCVTGLSVIYANPSNGAGFADAETKVCSGGTMVATVNVYGNPSVAPKLFIRKDDIVFGPASGAYDLVSIITHELGHTMGIGHPFDDGGSTNTAATMNNSFKFSLKQRNLYWYDQYCLDSQWITINPRTNRAGYRSLLSGGSVGPRSEFTSWNNISDVQTCKTRNTGSWSWCASMVDDGVQGWTPTMDENDLNTVGVIEPTRTYSGLVPTHWKDVDDQMDRVFYSDSNDFDYNSNGAYSSLNWDTSHLVRYKRSSNGFISTTSGTLWSCASRSSSSTQGNLSCSGYDRVYSGYPMSFAWLNNSQDSTVIAWSAQRRGDSANDGRILVSAGADSSAQNVISNPADMGVSMTTGGPAIACRNNSLAFSGDCLLVYVDDNDPVSEFGMRSIILEIGENSTGFDAVRVSPSSGYGAVIQTSNGWKRATSGTPALAYNNGAFYLAYKTIEFGNSRQTVKVLKTTDGQSWSFVRTLGYSDTSPSLFGVTHGNNYISMSAPKGM